MKEGSDTDGRGKEKTVTVEPDLPVDRGYAWMIVFAASLIMFLVIGALKCFGVFYVEVARQYDVTSKEIQAIQSLTGFFYLGLGPLSTILSMRFSSRSVIFVGGLLCGTGFLLTAFAPSLGYFYITYGCIVGFGYGLSFSPCVISFVHYFHKKRAIANGIVTAGGGLGAVILPYLMRYLIDVMTLQGCLMIFAGLLYNICVFSCLLRPHKNYPIKKLVRKTIQSNKRMSHYSEDQRSISLLDATDLVHYDDKSYASIEDGRSQNSFFSEGDTLIKHVNKRSKHSSKLPNASVISLKSFNPSLFTNPDNMTKSLCSEDLQSVDMDVSCKYDKQMNASVMSLKSFDPSVCSNIDAIGRSIYSDDQPSIETVSTLKHDNKHLNASVISLKSFDPSVNSTIDALGKSMYSEDQQSILGKSMYSEDQQSIGVASIGDSSRKQSLGVVSFDETMSKESWDKSKLSVSITEYKDEVAEETKSENREIHRTTSEPMQNTDHLESIELESNDIQKPIPKCHGKRRHFSGENNSLKAYSVNDKFKMDEIYKNGTDDSVSNLSMRAEKESLLKSVGWLKNDNIRHFNASVASLKSFDPSLCASVGIIAGISMQSIPQFIRGSHIETVPVETSEAQSSENSNPCVMLKKFFLSIEWSLFKNPVFLLYLVFVFCQALGYLSIFNILPPYCEEIHATDTQGAMIVSIVSVADLLGRLFFGWFNHVCQRHSRIIYFACCVLMGIGIVITPEIQTFDHLAAACGIYGFFMGGYNAVLFNVILTSLGLERFTHAWGFVAFSASVSLLLNPIESGFIKDTTGSWANAFRINGCVALFGCIMLPIIAFLENRQVRSADRKVEMEMDNSVHVDL